MARAGQHTVGADAAPLMSQNETLRAMAHNAEVFCREAEEALRGSVVSRDALSAALAWSGLDGVEASGDDANP